MRAHPPNPPYATAQSPLVEARAKLAQAESLRQSGQLDKALSICDALLSKYPKYVGALHTAGLIFADRRDNQNALHHLVRAVMYCPDYWQASAALAGVYLEFGAPEMAAKALEQAALLAPQDLTVIAMRAMVYYEQRDYERAAELYKTVLDGDPTYSGAAIGYALACLELGRYADAEKSLVPLLKKGERSIRVIDLLTRIPGISKVLDIEQLASEAKPKPADRREEFETTLGFVKSRISFAKGEIAETWANLVDANKRAAVTRIEDQRRNEKHNLETIANLRSLKTRLHPAKREKDMPISLFILGPSRSGKTTIETLTGQLPGVKMGFENPVAFKAAQQTFLVSGFVDGGFANLPKELEAASVSTYKKQLLARAGSAGIFTNTYPGLVHDAHRMAAIIPNARFVFVKRDPYDTALRIFMTLYRFGNAYAYDIKSVWEHIHWYYEMADLLAAQMPEFSTVISYEETVANPAAVVKKIADLCEIEGGFDSIAPIGNDQGVSLPYRDYMNRALGIN